MSDILYTLSGIKVSLCRLAFFFGIIIFLNLTFSDLFKGDCYGRILGSYKGNRY